MFMMQAACQFKAVENRRFGGRGSAPAGKSCREWQEIYAGPRLFW
jgi:hypothetical protein